MVNTNTGIQTVAPRDLNDLFWSLNILALQGFGGVIAVAQRELVDRKRWFTAQGFAEALAVAQVMPGPNIINLCADFGARHFGVRGVLVAIAGLLTIPFLITITLTALYTEFSHIVWVAGAVRGMTAVSAGLIIAAGLRLSSSLRGHVLGSSLTATFVVAGFVMVALLRWHLSAVLLGLGALACALTWRALKQQAKKQSKQISND